MAQSQRRKPKAQVFISFLEQRSSTVFHELLIKYGFMVLEYLEMQHDF